MSDSSYALMIKKFGDPLEVVEKVNTESQVSLSTPLSDGQVLIKFKASTINPADINIIQGTYATKSQLPAIVGNEGVAEVIKVGPGVDNLKPHDLVIPAIPSYGTWRSFAIANCSHLIAVDKSIDIFTAAQLAINPPTAYRMLKDFGNLEPGDSVLQNGANSAVGLYVIQLAKEWRLKTINVVRSRHEENAMKKLEDELKSFGADHVVTEEDLCDPSKMDKIWSSGTPRPKLALNCVSGENATNCMRYITEGGTMVTYGGMSKKPLSIPGRALIFKDIKFVGFWVSRWRKENKNSSASSEMMNDIVNLFKTGKLKSPNVIPFTMDRFKEALAKATAPYIEGKVILTT